MNNVSIIVPVYNAGKTLPACLDSIYAQTFRDFEAIVIDDGSTDASLKIAQTYEMRDPRFRVLHTDNFGVSHARNIGLDRAEGKWVCFVDSDDYLDSDYLKVLLDAALTHQVDTVFCSWYSNDDIVHFDTDGKIMDSEEALYYLFSSPYSHNFALWNKLFLRERIGKLRFDESLHYLEDGVFVCSYLKTGSWMAVIDRPLYHYYYYPNSLSHNRSLDEKRLSGFRGRSLMLKTVRELSPRLQHIARAKCYEHACYVLFNSYLGGYSSDVRKHKKILLRYYPDFIRYDTVPKTMKVRYTLYSLIILLNAGEGVANRFENYRLNRR